MHSMSLRRATRLLANKAARLLSFKQAVFVSKTLLEAQGFGSGGYLDSSGETSVFNLVKNSEPILFDVGAHVGEYTEAFLRVHPAGHSYVFEPSEQHFQKLSKRLGCYKNVTLVKCGLGNREREAPLYKDAEVTGLASLTKRRLDHYGINMDRFEMIKLQTLDQIIKRDSIQSIDLLKIDVEGHELDVLKGATNAFRDRRISLVQFEFGGCNLDTRTSLADFFYFFKERAFTIGLIQPSGRIQMLFRYDEFFEQYRTANFIAMPGYT
jgi:FkbM family methyltransferase